MEHFTTEFNGTLSQHLDRGQYFEIEFEAMENPKKTQIAFAKEKLSKDPETDIGMLLVLNYVNNLITANSRYGGEWVNAAEVQCDISRLWREPIKLTIHLWEESFHVAVNGKHRIRLNYCGNIHLLQALQIDNDVRRILRVDHRNTYPTPWPLWCRVHAPYGDEVNYFSCDVPAPPYQGLMVVIRVRCFGERGRLNINTKHEVRDKLFAHFSIRFDENCVVRNNKIDNIYGEEDRNTDFPFDFDREFRLGIACGEKAFLLAFNGLNLGSFAYRETGDLKLSTVGGFNMYSTLGLMFKVTEFDYIPLNGPECKCYERHTIL
ncbi:uncharacterized protein LOC101900448 [Musca domestica]|uniref:Galectin n=1 Tax=Musca domestica TaxID=7370 RepID=T1PCZ4_MUSDO|nr:uncharacterized protein LOC101900448 [Musca domestica]